MTFSIAAVLLILVAALVLFITEAIRVEVTAMLVLLSLTLSGIITSDQAIQGFSNPAVVTIVAVFVLSAGLFRTGVANFLGHQVLRLAGTSEAGLIAVLMLTVGLLSGIMNNIGVTALMLPVVLDIARRVNLAPSKLLIPLAFGSLLGGLTTLIGTAPNVLISGALAANGLEPFGMFDFTPVGLTALAAGIAYMVLVGRHLLPSIDLGRDSSGNTEDLGTEYELRTVLFTIALPVGTHLAGQSLADSRLGSALGVNVMAIRREGHMHLAPGPDALLRDGDELIVEGQSDQLEHLRDWRSIQLGESWIPIEGLVSASIQFTELEVADDPSLVGKTIVETNFRWRFGSNVLAICQEDCVRLTRLRGLKLAAGDTLLVLGNAEQAEELVYRKEFSRVTQLTVSEVADRYNLSRRLFSIRVPEDSSLDGRSISDTHLRDALGFTVVGIRRNGGVSLMPTPDQRISAGDALLVEGRAEDFELLNALQGLQVEREATPEIEALESQDVGMVEVTLSPRTQLAGRTLRDLHFRERYGLSVVSIWREGRAYRTNLRDMVMRFGDALLVYGKRDKIRLLAEEPDVLVLSEENREEFLTNKAPFATAIVVGMLIAVALFDLPIYIGALTAATLMILTGCLTAQEAYRFIEWRVIVLIVGMLSLGVAMQSTGAAELVATEVLGYTAPLGSYAVLASMFLMCVLAAQMMPTVAVAVLMSQIGLSTAQQLDLSPDTLMMVVALGSSCAFMSPLGHPSNLLVMGVGGYKFTDYTKVGVGLTLVIFLVAMLILPLIWPLNP
jgi:di/tricarboxylate transporter